VQQGNTAHAKTQDAVVESCKVNQVEFEEIKEMIEKIKINASKIE